VSWVKGSNKNAEIAAQNFGIWEWRLNSGAYPELCEVEGDLYWTELDWEDRCIEYCDEINKRLSRIKTHIPPVNSQTEPKKEKRIWGVIKRLRGAIG